MTLLLLWLGGLDFESCDVLSVVDWVVDDVSCDSLGFG